MIAWVNRLALLQVSEEIDRSDSLETGGVLIGYWSQDLKHVVIVHSVGPGPLAVHSRDSFLPDGNFHEKEIARLYDESGRTCTYLGDWHTHPIGGTELSRWDRRTLQVIARSPEARARTPIMAIIDTEEQWKLRIWALYPRGTLNKWWSSVVALRTVFFDP